MFFKDCTNVWPKFILILAGSLKKHWKMQLLMHCNTYDSAKDLKFLDLLGQLIDNNISKDNF